MEEEATSNLKYFLMYSYFNSLSETNTIEHLPNIFFYKIKDFSISFTEGFIYFK